MSSLPHKTAGSRNRPQQERLFRIFKMLKDGGYPNCTDFAEDLEVTKRTIMRDMDFLRDRMHLPIEFDSRKNGFYLAKPVEHLPVIEISPEDLVWLFVSERVAAQYGDLKLGRQLQETFARLAGILGDPVRTTWSELEELLTVQHAGVSPADLEIFQEVKKAATEHHILRFSYKGTNDTRYRQRKVHPYHLGLVNGNWYLFGWDEGRREMRTFSMSRMRSVKNTDRKYEVNPAIDVRDSLSQGMGVIYNKAVKVRLQFTQEVAVLVAERQWHHTQKLRGLPGGHLEVCLQIADTKELRNWIMSWGPRVEVLEPESLRQKIAKLACETASIYQETRD